MPKPITRYTRTRTARFTSTVLNPNRNCLLNTIGSRAGSTTNATSSGTPTREGIDRNGRRRMTFRIPNPITNSARPAAPNSRFSQPLFASKALTTSARNTNVRNGIAVVNTFLGHRIVDDEVGEAFPAEPPLQVADACIVVGHDGIEPHLGGRTREPPARLDSDGGTHLRQRGRLGRPP